jgi:hypothetical protein
VCESIQKRFARWRLENLLVKYSSLRLVPLPGDSVQIVGLLAFEAVGPGKEWIKDEYEIEISVHQAFPRQIPSVKEIGGRISPAFHKLSDGSLCLGSPARLLLVLAESPSLLRFVEHCVIPYLYGHSYFKRNGVMPFGDLAHGARGLREDLMAIFRTNLDNAIPDFLRLGSMKKRIANKESCPCGGGRRLGRCHSRTVNFLRSRLGRYQFRLIQQNLAREDLSSSTFRSDSSRSVIIAGQPVQIPRLRFLRTDPQALLQSVVPLASLCSKQTRPSRSYRSASQLAQLVNDLET